MNRTSHYSKGLTIVDMRDLFKKTNNRAMGALCAIEIS